MSHFGVPMAEEKTIFPSSSLKFLRIHINTVLSEFYLPMEKITKAKLLIYFLIRRKKVLLKELQSLLGVFAFAWIMPVGRIFSHIQLNNSLKADVLIWLQFLDSYNRRSFFQDEFVLAADFKLFTDTAGSRGFKTIWRTHWCCGEWPLSWIYSKAVKNIVLLELFPVIVALEITGEFFINKCIIIQSDNKGVVFAVYCPSSRSPPVIKLLN